MTTNILDHWVAGAAFTGESTRTAPVYNPARGIVQKDVRLASTADVDVAVQAAKAGDLDPDGIGGPGIATGESADFWNRIADRSSGDTRWDASRADEFKRLMESHE